MKRFLGRVLDVLFLPFLAPSALLLKAVRRIGVQRMPLCKGLLLRLGVFPIRRHYYEPQFDYRKADPPLSADRHLPGIDWNEKAQLEWLASFTCAGELEDLPKTEAGPLQFHLDNDAFQSGDAEYWYQLIRAVKPARIFEVGSGHSTLMAAMAIRKNREQDPSYACRHVCIEPYEMPWLERTGAEVLRRRIEDMETGFFSELEPNDVLFIDSSHVIRPQGDVLFEYLTVLPTLRKGVIVHVHDVFSPKNYLKQFLQDEARFWNEQYLLEAFLTNNCAWEIIGALNYLHHNHYEKLKVIAPFLTPDREPGSFYLRKIA